MDPFVATIVKQAAALGLAIGTLAAIVYGLVQYAKLQHALTLNVVPPGIS